MMHIEVTRTPKDNEVVTARLAIAMTRKEWREWNQRVQNVDRTCPLVPMKDAIRRFVAEHCEDCDQEV